MFRAGLLDFNALNGYRSLKIRAQQWFSRGTNRQSLSAAWFSYRPSTVLLISLLGWAGPLCHAQQAKKRFTVVDEIGLKLFADSTSVEAERLRFSPDGNYFVVDTERSGFSPAHGWRQ